MMPRSLIFSSIITLVASFTMTPMLHAQQPPIEAPAPQLQATVPREVTVAVLEFAAKDAANPQLGAEIAEALAAMLSGEPGFTLVDRTTLTRVLQEQELNLTGLVSTEQAVQIGKLVGARILVIGRAFVLGKQTYVTAKLIGVETSLVDGVMVKEEGQADLGLLVGQLGEKVSERLREGGAKLIASDVETDPMPALKKAYAGRKLPRVAVIIPEEHHAAPQAARVRPVDPAVETEIKRLLLELGFAVQDVPQNGLADFARNWEAGRRDAWPRSLAEVDMVIVGEGFSEFAARIGNLVSCSARAEINVIQRSDGSVVHTGRTTTRAVDLSEQVAGKTALQRAGRSLGIRFLQDFKVQLEAKASR